MNRPVFAFARVALAVAGFSLASVASAQTEIQFWHSMTGALGDRVGDLAKKYNDSQKDYKVVPVFKGTYPESMAALVAATRAGNPPHMVQIFEVGTGTMMASGKAIKPVYEVMAQAGEKFDPKAYVPAVAGYYSTPTGQMLSFPFNSSTPVFYFNKDAFKKAGLDGNKPPKTWKECQPEVYTQAWPEALSLSAAATRRRRSSRAANARCSPRPRARRPTSSATPSSSGR